MFELVKKTLLTGIGMAAMTRDKAEEFAKDFARQAELSEEEGRRLVDDLMSRTDQARRDLKDQVERLVGQAVDKVPVVSRAEYDKLAARVAALEAAAFRNAAPADGSN